MNEQLTTLEHAQQTAIDLAIQVGPKVIVALLVLAAGLTVIFTRPFKVGEYISNVDVEGTGEEIDLFNNVLSHPDRSLIVIPNRKSVGEALHNFGTLRQLDVVVGVANDPDIKQHWPPFRTCSLHTRKILHDPDPFIRLLTLAHSSVRIAVCPWTTVFDLYSTSGDIAQAVLETFRERGIHIPFPQREVCLLGQT